LDHLIRTTILLFKYKMDCLE